jgi:uncharacterized protein with ATP-grasp and redox domains
VKLHLDCIPCLLRQALDATKMSSTDEVTQERALREVMNYLSNVQWNMTTPELATYVHRIIKRISGNDDPYSQLKEKYNHAVLALYPKLEAMVESSKDPFMTAAKLAIAGNIIDFGPKINIDVEKTIDEVLSNDLAINDIEKLKSSIIRAESVLYLADNAGESVFDKLLIKELSKQNVKVTYAVKNMPILNDATFKDAEMAGITKIVNVISTGTDCTGILFRECSPRFMSEFDNSSFIISKGQGNYESLSDVKNKELFFFLKVKCPLIAEDVGVKKGSAVLKQSLKS